jgi:hypothetical protein
MSTANSTRGRTSTQDKVHIRNVLGFLVTHLGKELTKNENRLSKRFIWEAVGN